MEKTLIKLTHHDETKKRAHDSQIIGANENLKFALIMEGIGTLCLFYIWVVSELSRRHGNHKPQRFYFLIECKLNDGFVYFILQIIFI